MQQQQKHAHYTVSVRIRPNLSNSPTVFEVNNHSIKHYKEKSILTYIFDKVYESDRSNQDIYEDGIRNTIKHFITNKINTTFLAYGQTGSGKTYTLFGHQNQQGQNRGLCEFIVQQIVQENKSNKYILCTFIQIYKQKVTDLISGETISLRENAKGELTLDNQTVNKVKTKEDILQLLKKAYKNKIFGKSYVHSESSRSHVMMSLTIQGLPNKLNIVDLCGSEVLTYQFDQKQRSQTNSINLSLFTLNSIIHDLCDRNNHNHIPFRNSVLTRLLKSSLISTSKTQIYLFCNISPQKHHQDFSSSTLRFGQLAINIDQNQNYKEQKINLSQKKRDMKKISNVIQINPKTLSEYPSYNIQWETYKITYHQQKIIIYELKGNPKGVNILFLHAYGGGCSGQDWNGFISYIQKEYHGCNLFSVDFPGFGNSGGKKFTSRSQKFNQKQQPIQFMIQLFKIMKFSSKNKVYLVGYDLGGAIALSASFHSSLSKSIKGTMVFHPTWTDSIQRLSLINLPVLLMWVTVETFHLVSAGQKMSKVIKNSLLYKLNIGPYTNQKAAGYYDIYSDTLSGIMIEFMKAQENNMEQSHRGKIVEQIISFNVSQEQQKIETIKQAVRQFYKMIENKSHKQIHQSIIKGGQNKPKAVRLASTLPTLDIHSLNFSNLVKFGIIDSGSVNYIDFEKLPFLIPKRQLQVKTMINLSVLDGQMSYLSYDGKGQIGITHKAYVMSQQLQQEIIQSNSVKVNIKQKDGTLKAISVNLDDVIQLNSPTVFAHNVLGCLVFEDSVSCKYSSKFMKLIMMECCYQIKDLIPKMNFQINNLQLLNLQKQCSKRIFKIMDLKHLVHQGIDNTRYTGIQVGRLAYYGQGNCHHLASVAAALLLPFGKLLGWDVIFRGGSFFKTGRQIDEQGNPIQGWNGKPNVKVQDHTWLELLYKPSYQLTVFDPSFSICSQPVDQIYTFEGKMHISGKKLNGSLQPQIPSYLYDKELKVA